MWFSQMEIIIYPLLTEGNEVIQKGRKVIFGKVTTDTFKESRDSGNGSPALPAGCTDFKLGNRSRLFFNR